MQLQHDSFAKVRALISNERNSETWDGKISVNTLEELEFLVSSEPSIPAKAAPSPTPEGSSLPSCKVFA